jgi:peptidoglycan/LPS O-acetylase OafA/YrhL
MRADSLFFGVVLGCLQHYRPEWFRRLARLGPVWVLLALAALALPWCCSLTQDAVTYTVGFTALYVGFGGLVLLAGAYPTFGRDGPPGRLTRALAWVGVYSYTIYLAHSIIYILPGSWGLRRCVLSLIPGNGPLPAMWVDRALFFGLSIAGGVLLSHGVERPFLRWRERWSFTAPRATATPMPALARAA